MSFICEWFAITITRLFNGNNFKDYCCAKFSSLFYLINDVASKIAQDFNKMKTREITFDNR